MQNIHSLISTTIKSLYNIDFTPEISPAPKPELGEYCIGVFQLAKPLGKAPNQIAAELADELAKHTETFISTNSIGGYVNFFLADSVWISLFSVIARNETIQEISTSETSGSLHASRGQEQKTIVVDYIGANVGKPLHIGHICTPSIGQTICNVYRHLGYRVIGDSHFGDWGGIFGKLIYGLKNPIISGSTLFLDLSNELKKQHILNQGGIDFLLKIYQSVTKEIENDISIYNTLINSYIRAIDEKKWPQKFQNGGYKNAIDGKDIEGFYELEKAVKIHNTTFYSELKSSGVIFRNVEQFTRNEFKKITDGDNYNIELWQIVTSISIAETEKKLELLNVHTDYNIGESFYEGLNLPRPNNEDYPNLEFTMKDIVVELIRKGIATQNEDGSVGVVFPEEAKMPSCILQKKDGTGLYLTSDLAAIKYRLTNGWNPSKIVYSVDVRQQLHLKQAFWIARAAWGQNPIGNTQKQEIQGSENFSKRVYSAVNEQEKSDTDEEVRSFSEFPEFFHAFNGFIKLKEGAMSTRHGTVIFLEALITEGFERTRKILEEKGRSLSDSDIQAITIAAIKYSYLAQDREKDVVFDWDKALNFEGNSGPYIQYAYVRAKKILPVMVTKEAIQEKNIDSSSGLDCRASIAMTDTIKLSSYDKSLIQSLSRFNETVMKTATSYKPHHLALYAYELAVTFNGFYVHTPKILEESDENVKNFRLSLVTKTVEILKESFELLGIMMPNEM